MVPIKLSLLSWHLVTPVLQDSFFPFFFFFPSFFLSFFFFQKHYYSGKISSHKSYDFFPSGTAARVEKNEFNDA